MALIDLLEHVALFEGLSPNELGAVAKLCREKTFPAGSIVIRQGETGDDMYIIEEGRIEILVMGALPERPIVVLGKGQIFGEMSLIDFGYRSATGRTTVPTRVQVLEGKSFTRLFQQDNHIGYVVMRNLAADLSFKLRHRNLATM